MSIHLEQPLKTRTEILVILCVFLCVCFLPFIGFRELFGRECEMVAMAQEISLKAPWPLAQGELLPYRYPLFPLFVKGMLSLGMPPEWAVRLVSILTLLGMAALTYVAAFRSLKRTEAGAIAAVVILTNAFIIDRGIWGYPDLLGYFFVQSAWVLWFHYGMMEHRWKVAWFLSTLFIVLAFFTIGPGAALFFVVPLFFMRRPISGIFRLSSWGGFLSITFFVIIVLIWAYCRTHFLMLQEPVVSKVIWGIFEMETSSILWRIFAPIDVFFRLLPWALFLYPAFCPAYKQFENNPVFTNYTRNIFVVSLLLLFLIPWYRVADDIRILIPPFAFLIALHYPVFIRRNGTLLARILKPIKGLLCFLSLIILFYHLSQNPEFAQYLPLNSTDSAKISNQIMNYFQNIGSNFAFHSDLNPVGVGIAAIAFLISGLLMTRSGRALPLWAQISMIMAIGALLYWGTNTHRRFFNRTQSNFAQLIVDKVNTVLDSSRCPTSDYIIYKDPKMRNLYGELVYAKIPVKKIAFSHLSALSADTIIYMTHDVPHPLPNYRWDDNPLLKTNYQDLPLFIWVAHPQSVDSSLLKQKNEKESLLLIP